MSSGYRRPFEETDTEDELQDIDPLPPSLQNPRLPQKGTVRVEQPKLEHDHGDSFTERESTPFIAAGDIPKSRYHSHRFNLIRPKENVEDIVKEPDTSSLLSVQQSRRDSKPSLSRMYLTSLADSGDETQEIMSMSTPFYSHQQVARRCPACRKHMKRCSHKQGSTPAILASRTSTPSVPLKESKTIIKTAGKPKKDGTLYRRNLHDRSKGLSMTPSAVDYRERKDVQKQYLARLAQLLDTDIVNQVEAEGGITPEGRTFKAAVRMVERAIDERAGRCKDEPKKEQDSASPKSKSVVDDIDLLRERALHAEEKLAAFKQALRNIMVD